MTEDSLQKRYLFKLITNLAGLAIGVITQAIIPRSLGPKAYGDFNFLTNFFSQITAFMDMGTSTAFYTKLSQRQRDFGLVLFYGIFCTIVCLAIFAFVISVQLISNYQWIWPDQELVYVYLAAGLAIIVWINGVLNRMADAYGITVTTEKVRILQKIVAFFLILVLFFTHALKLTEFFFYNYFIMIILSVGFWWATNRHTRFVHQNWRLSKNQLYAYLEEFYRYSHPLFMYSLIGLITGVLDRWLLQIFSGSVEQGFYGLSYQIGALCFLFNSAMTPLFLREFSIAFEKRDRSNMAYLFRRFIPLFYSVAAFFSCFISVQASKVIHILGGAGYQDALMVVVIMGFYPIHQTYGQLSGSVFLATGQTGLYRNIGIFFMLIGIPLTYVFLAPSEKMGLNAGATGLAIKMVLLQILWVNVQLYFNTKLLNLNFLKYLAHQFISVAILLGIALVSAFGMDYAFKLYDKVVLNFVLSGIFYTLVVMIIGFCKPIIFGIKKQDLKAVFQYALARRVITL